MRKASRNPPHVRRRHRRRTLRRVRSCPDARARRPESPRHRPHDLPERHDVGPFHPACRSVCLRRLGLLEESRGARRARAGDDDGGLRPGRPLRPPCAGARRNGVGYAPRRYRSTHARRRRGRGGRETCAKASASSSRASRTAASSGIRTMTAAGPTEDIRARLVVGADGKRSRFARAVRGGDYDRQPAATCSYYAYWSGFDAPDTRLFVRDGLFCVAAPTNDGLDLRRHRLAARRVRAGARRYRQGLSRGGCNDALGRRPPRVRRAGRPLRRHRRTWMDSSAPHPARAGRSSAMPDTTRIRSPRRE